MPVRVDHEFKSVTDAQFAKGGRNLIDLIQDNNLLTILPLKRKCASVTGRWRHYLTTPTEKPNTTKSLARGQILARSL